MVKLKKFTQWLKENHFDGEMTMAPNIDQQIWAWQGVLKDPNADADPQYKKRAEAELQRLQQQKASQGTPQALTPGTKIGGSPGLSNAPQTPTPQRRSITDRLKPDDDRAFF